MRRVWVADTLVHREIAGRAIRRPHTLPQLGSKPALGPGPSSFWASFFLIENKEVELDQHFFFQTHSASGFHPPEET